ncbi:MAG TPA: hypothetical protein VM096_10075 [Vicinamibacterales bacterium]|nr:hypothetical protein [Vicinamibacterales bacterium]
MIVPLHILAGMLALVFGYVALFTKKGAKVHRKTGMVFVFAMIALSLTGAYRAGIIGSTTSVIAGLLTFYFVLTGVLTVTRSARPGWIEFAGVAIAVAIGMWAISTGVSMAGKRPEAPPMLVFGVMALLGAIGDVKMIHAGGIAGKPRIKRHLWRLCFAMWVAAASFFWGPPNRVPEIIRIPALLPIPVLTPVVVMLYWLWRMRGKNAVRGIVTSSPIVHVDHTAEVMS